MYAVKDKTWWAGIGTLTHSNYVPEYCKFIRDMWQFINTDLIWWLVKIYKPPVFRLKLCYKENSTVFFLENVPKARCLRKNLKVYGELAS